MKYYFFAALATFVSLILLGCVIAYTSAPVLTHTTHPGVITAVVDPSLERFAPAWQVEIGRRFPNAVGVLCHGGEIENGRWIVSARSLDHLMTIQELVAIEQARYPGRTIVLLACNVGHLKLGVPGVYYFPSSVWCVPDRAVTPDTEHDSLFRTLGDETRWAADPDICGNIFEAEQD